MADSEPDPRLAALAGALERTSHRVDRIETLLRVLSEQIAAVTGPDDEDGTEQTAVRSWLLGEDTAQAHDDLADLIGWLGAVYLRFPDAALASCWAWHPTVVEELWWLRQAHHDAYTGPHASPGRAADWHDRQRPGVVRRIRAAIGSCELALHTQAPAAPVVPLAGSADRIAQAWAPGRSAPVPTEPELVDADHADHAEHHERRARHR